MRGGPNWKRKKAKRSNTGRPRVGASPPGPIALSFAVFGVAFREVKRGQSRLSAVHEQSSGGRSRRFFRRRRVSQLPCPARGQPGQPDAGGLGGFGGGLGGVARNARRQWNTRRGIAAVLCGAGVWDCFAAGHHFLGRSPSGAGAASRRGRPRGQPRARRSPLARHPAGSSGKVLRRRAWRNPRLDSSDWV